ncbi:hypothetical protein QDY65_00390 [Pyrococcus kukulkanii]|uniref:hypothetical protein n=1 Tax=Pyrococcus kukulkanii TaxID=1609559 RepID=UPI003563A2E0
MLYEETVQSRGYNLFLAILFAPILIVLFAVRNNPPAVGIVGIEAIIVFAIIWDISALNIRITQEEIRIRGRLGLLVRKTIKIEDIESYSVKEGWMSCSGLLHFMLPAKACVLITRKRGISVSFSTNRPEEIAYVFSTLNIPRAP